MSAVIRWSCITLRRTRSTRQPVDPRGGVDERLRVFGTAVNASTVFATTTLADKPWIDVDNTGGGTDGNLYICWTRFIDTDADGQANTSELRTARSTDGGTTWTNEQVIAAKGTAPFGCSIGVSSDASVAVVWADRSDKNI